MLKSAKSFLNIPIISLYNTTKIGSLMDFIIDPDLGKVVGVIGERSGFFKKRIKVISIVDIREISERALLVDNENVLVPQEDIIKINNIINSDIKILENKVITESGKYLGKVTDFLIDDFFYISKLYVNPVLTNILTTQLIISRDLILKVTKEEIIVSDDILEKPREREAVRVPQ